MSQTATSGYNVLDPDAAWKAELMRNKERTMMLGAKPGPGAPAAAAPAPAAAPPDAAAPAPVAMHPNDVAMAQQRAASMPGTTPPIPNTPAGGLWRGPGAPPPSPALQETQRQLGRIEVAPGARSDIDRTTAYPAMQRDASGRPMLSSNQTPHFQEPRVVPLDTPGAYNSTSWMPFALPGQMRAVPGSVADNMAKSYGNPLPTPPVSDAAMRAYGSPPPGSAPQLHPADRAMMEQMGTPIPGAPSPAQPPTSQTVGAAMSLPGGVAPTPPNAAAPAAAPYTPIPAEMALQNTRRMYAEWRTAQPREYELASKTPEERAAFRTSDMQWHNEMGRLQQEITARKGATPQQAQTPEQVSAGRASLNKQLVGAEEDRAGGPTQTPPIDFSKYGPQEEAAAVQRNMAAAAKNKGTADYLQSKRGIGDEFALKTAAGARDLYYAQQTAAINRAKSEGIVTDPALAKAGAEGAILTQQNKNETDRLTNEVTQMRLKAEKTVAAPSIEQQAVLANPTINKAIEGLTPLFQSLGGHRLTSTSENEAEVGAYENQVANLEKQFNGLPPDQQATWRNQLATVLTTKNTGSWWRRAFEGMVSGWSEDTPNGRAQRATARLYRLMGGSVNAPAGASSSPTQK